MRSRPPRARVESELAGEIERLRAELAAAAAAPDAEELLAPLRSELAAAQDAQEQAAARADALESARARARERAERARSSG